MRLRLLSGIRLEIEPIPESTWGTSLANLLPGPIWDDLRREVYTAFGHACAVCGATDRQLQCHERWSFDDKKKVQKLVGFQCLCSDCHRVKHWGRTVAEAHRNGDVEAIPRLAEHFCRVNSCSTDAFSLHKVEVGDIAQKRSRHRYTVDFGAFRPDLVEVVWLRRKKK